MLSQFLNQMDDYLANKPFKRRWWSRHWIVHMTIEPPLRKDKPLWKRSQDQLRLLRLFNLSPEELREKIKEYWKKPAWRRWFISFGMKKKIDVWNYYQRCLAYQAVRPEQLEQESVVLSSQSRLLLNELGLALYRSHVKFEAYLEKSCRNPQCTEEHFFQKIETYKQRLKKVFSTKLKKALNQIKREGDQFLLKQQAEKEYQQVELFMGKHWERYFKRSHDFSLRYEEDIAVVQTGETGDASRRQVVEVDANMNPVMDECVSDEGWSRHNPSCVMRANFRDTMGEIVREPSYPLDTLHMSIGLDGVQERNKTNPKRGIVVYRHSQTVSTYLESILPSRVNHYTGIASLDGAKKWVKNQRHRLNSLIEEGSLPKVEELLQTSLGEIKEITEFYLERCEIMLSNIQGNHEAYDVFSKYLDNSQSRLRILLQGGMLLFHPDHVMNLTHSQEMWELITRYSKSYLKQSRCYIDKFKNYHLRIEEFYLHAQNELQRPQSRRDCSEFGRLIKALEKSVKDLEQSFKELQKQLNELKIKQSHYGAKLKSVKTQLVGFNDELNEFEEQRKQDKEKSDKKIEKLEEDMKLIKDVFKVKQFASTSSASDAQMLESSNAHFFKL